MSALLELYDHYRELEDEFQRFKANLPNWIVDGPPGKSSTRSDDDRGLHQQVEALERRVRDLEQSGTGEVKVVGREGSGGRVKVLGTTDLGAAGRPKVLDI